MVGAKTVFRIGPQLCGVFACRCIYDTFPESVLFVFLPDGIHNNTDFYLKCLSVGLFSLVFIVLQQFSKYLCFANKSCKKKIPTCLVQRDFVTAGHMIKQLWLKVLDLWSHDSSSRWPVDCPGSIWRGSYKWRLSLSWSQSTDVSAWLHGRYTVFGYSSFFGAVTDSLI